MRDDRKSCICTHFEMIDGEERKLVRKLDGDMIEVFEMKASTQKQYFCNL